MKTKYLFSFFIMFLFSEVAISQAKMDNCFENDPFTQAYYNDSKYKFISDARIKKITNELTNLNLMGVKVFNQSGELISEQEYRKVNNNYIKCFQIDFVFKKELATIESAIKYFKSDTSGGSKSNYYNFSEIMILSNCLWERKLIKSNIHNRDSIVINKTSNYEKNLLQETKLFFDSILISDIFYKIDNNKSSNELPDIYKIGAYEYQKLNLENKNSNEIQYRFFLSFDREQFIDVTYRLNNNGLIVDRFVKDSPNSLLNAHYVYEYFK